MPETVSESAVAKCSSCLQLFKWVPVLFITCIIVWSYYAYIVQLCFYAVTDVVEKIFYILTYNILFFMFVWSYWKTIFTPVGTVPPQFILPLEEAESLQNEQIEDNQRRLLENFAKDLPINCRTMNGCVRYCEKCHHVKPDRAHHCSVCGTCVLKMDHHCPWVNNCVAFTNYKFFVLFLGYGLLYCSYIAVTTIKYFIQIWTKGLEIDKKYHILFLFIVSVMFAISLISLFGYHCYLVAVNKSTLESFRKPIFIFGPEKDAFNLGTRVNFYEVFGDNPKKWFLPVYSSLGNGVSFRTRVLQVSNTYSTEANTNQDGSEDELLSSQFLA